MARGRFNILHRTVVIAAAIMIFLALVGIVQSTGTSIITNDLDTDLRFAIYSDTHGYDTLVRKKGEKVFFTFDPAISAFWNVSMLAPNEVPEKSKTIQIWSRAADPTNPSPLSQWDANEIGLYMYDPVNKGWVFCIPMGLRLIKRQVSHMGFGSDFYEISHHFGSGRVQIVCLQKLNDELVTENSLQDRSIFQRNEGLVGTLVKKEQL